MRPICHSLFAVLFSAWIVFGGGAPAAEAATRPLNTGVSYVYANETAAFEHVKAAGAKLVLTPLTWEHIAPEDRPAAWQPANPADPHYDWTEHDLWVTNAVQAGLTPVLQVRSAPKWAQRCGFIGLDSPCDPDPAALAEFTTAAVTRYSGQFSGLPRVRYWQGLNEPNLSLFFNPQFDTSGKPVSAELYRVLINTFYAAVKAVDPSNLVIAAGLGPIAVPKFSIGPMQFARELLCMRGKERFRPVAGDCGGGVRFDIFDVHPYTTGGPTHRSAVNDVQLSGLSKLKRLLAAADKAGRIKGAFPQTPLWVTEFSWDSNPPDPGGLRARVLTRWTSEALFEAWKAGISEFFWFTLRDFPADPSAPFSETLQAGLYYRAPNVVEDQPKEVFYAFRFPFVAYPGKGGLSFWGRTPNSKAGKVTIQVRAKGGGWRRVLTTQADGAGIFRGKAPIQYGSNRSGAVRAHFRKGASLPFSMRPIPDFPQPPFGRPTG